MPKLKVIRDINLCCLFCIEFKPARWIVKVKQPNPCCDLDELAAVCDNHANDYV